MELPHINTVISYSLLAWSSILNTTPDEIAFT